MSQFSVQFFPERMFLSEKLAESCKQQSSIQNPKAKAQGGIKRTCAFLGA